METYLLNHLALCSSQLIESNPNAIEKGRIRTGAVQMIFANRTTSAFITPEEVEVLETWGGKSVLTSLSELEIEKEVSEQKDAGLSLLRMEEDLGGLESELSFSLLTLFFLLTSFVGSVASS